jgi:hypothetical protein
MTTQTKTRRKKKYLLLKGRMGNYIVGSREWYDSRGIGRKRGRNQMWVIAAQSDDREMLVTMGNLTDRYVGMKVRNEMEGV